MSKNSKKSTYFADVVGQDEVKEQLIFLAEGANVDQGYCPPILLEGPKGIGKTMIGKAFGRTLTDEHGAPRKVVLLNSSTVKSVPNFMLNIYPKILKIGTSCCVFFDESHMLPKDMQNLLLTVLNPEKGRLRTIEHNGQDVDFNLCELAFFFATTDTQQMNKPLVDRLERVSLRDYNANELAQIVNIHLGGEFRVDKQAMAEIVPTMRGNGRSAVQRAQQIERYCKLEGKDDFTKQDWQKLKVKANIKPFGLTNGEIQVLRLLNDRGACTLQTLVAATSQNQSMLRLQLEPTLVRLGFMQINVTRQITPAGIDALRACDE